jgi:hypothetical protein
MKLFLLLLMIVVQQSLFAQIIRPETIRQKQLLVGSVTVYKEPLAANHPARVVERTESLVCVPNTCVVLPVHLLEFWGKVKPADNLLEWKTGSENQLSHYVVERSVNARQFDSVGTVIAVNAAGVHKYSFIDALPVTGANYYRLQMVNSNSSFEYSKTIRLNRPDIKSMVVYPNPASDQATLSFSAAGAKDYHWQIQDITGKILQRNVYKSMQGVNIFSINTGKLANGSYIITIAEGINEPLQFVKLQVMH